MSSFARFLLAHRLLPQQIIRLEADLFLALDNIAASQGQSVQGFVADVLQEVVYGKRAQARIERQWESLTAREREVAALACLGYTNKEIGDLLTISPNTVRTHIQNILDKYGAGSKVELRQTLSKWDFDTWFASQQWPESTSKTESSPGTTPIS